MKTGFHCLKKAMILLLLSLPIALMAQNIHVKGNVVDNTGEAVIGASVVAKGTTNGTITDLDGNFTLSNVKKGTTIVVSFVGYLPTEVKANSEFLKISLEEDSQTLQEVVVTGYGGIQKAKTLTAAAVTVKMDQIAKLPVTSISEGLGGRVTGVITQKSSGAPGETTKIWIRGGSSILYVIDDVVMETTQGEVFFNRLRPEDIASMSILKDASATAIYGPRANDGVVVIQTKRGQEGAPEITFSQKVSIMTPSYRAKPMKPYDFVRTRNALKAANYDSSPEFTPVEVAKYYIGSLYQGGKSREEIMNLVNNEYGQYLGLTDSNNNPRGYTMSEINDLFDPYKTDRNIQDFYCFYDPWEMFDNTQPMYQTNVSLRGGSERLKYYSSLGYLNQKGVSKTYDYKQYNIILNTDAYLLKDKSLKFSLNLNASMADKNQPDAGEGVFNSAMYGDWMANRPPIWSTGKRKANSPREDLNTGFNNNSDNRLQTNIALKWNLPWVQGLAVSGSINYNTSYNMNKQFHYNQENVFGSPSQVEPNEYKSHEAWLQQNWENYKLTTGLFQIDYSNTFGKHTVSAMANYQSQVRNTNSTKTRAEDYASTLIPQIDAGAKRNPAETKGTEERWGSSSFIGRVTYDYAGKYLFQYSGNYNASLSYSPDKRWGYFQAVSAGWVLTEESWFKNLVSPKILSQLKIRAGYGIVGGEIGKPFSFLNQYAQNDTKVLLGDGMNPNVAWYESHRASDLTWSSSRQLSAGVDFSLFKNRLSGSFDTYLYKNNGAEMNMSEELIRADILGMPNIPQINAPFETNRKGGYEFSLNWQDKIGEWGYRVGVNYSYWDQRFTRHSDSSTNYYYSKLDNIGKRMNVSSENGNVNPYESFYLNSGLFGSYDQLYNSVLFYRFADANTVNELKNYNLGSMGAYDLNGDGRLGAGDQVWNNKPGTVPLTQYGVTLGASYKGFDLEVFFQGAMNVTGTMPSPLRSQQAYMWNYGQYAFQNSYLPSNPNIHAPLPQPSSFDQGWGSSYIDWWVFDASYLKLKNISLTYDMKRYVLKKVDVIKGLTLNLVVTNAFTWTKKSYPLKGLQDPEFITSNANYFANGGKLGSYPTQRSYTFSVNVTL